MKVRTVILCAHLIFPALFAKEPARSVPEPSMKKSGVWADSHDDLPDYSKAESGRLSATGVGRLFDQCFVVPKPENIRWIGGGYQIERVEGAMSGSVTAFFILPADQIETFATSVIEAWRRRFADSPDFRISDIRTKRAGEWNEPYLNSPVPFATGTIYLGCRNRFAARAEHDFRAYLDPSSGMVWISSYRGHVEHPAQRGED